MAETGRGLARAILDKNQEPMEPMTTAEQTRLIHDIAWMLHDAWVDQARIRPPRPTRGHRRIPRR